MNSWSIGGTVVTKTLPVLLNSYFTNEFVNLIMNMHVMSRGVYLKSTPRHTLKLNIAHSY